MLVSRHNAYNTIIVIIGLYILTLCFILRYWNNFVQSDMFCKYQVDVLTGGRVTLGDILLCNGLLSYFMEVL